MENLLFLNWSTYIERTLDKIWERYLRTKETQQHLLQTSEWQCATVRVDPPQVLCGTYIYKGSEVVSVSVSFIKVVGVYVNILNA